MAATENPVCTPITALQQGLLRRSRGETGRLHDYWGDGDGFLYFPMLSRPACVVSGAHLRVTTESCVGLL